MTHTHELPMTPGDLGELIASFSDVTARLESTHDQLRAEVARLSTELSLANEQLERSRRLAALGEMAAGIAHEVRNPLGSIRLYARMLVQDLADRPNERATVLKIDAAAKSLDAVVGDVLAFSREFKLRLTLDDAREVIDRAIDACQSDRAPGWSEIEVVRLDLDRPRSTRFTAPIDRPLVVQALVNVLRNAFEAAAESPDRRARIEIDAGTREQSRPDGSRAPCSFLSVRDSGPGIPEDVVARMFNPFFTTRATGTGLGLSIVHRIVDAHGGHVRVMDHAREGSDGRSESGATVEMIFPCSAEASHVPACATAA